MVQNSKAYKESRCQACIFSKVMKSIFKILIYLALDFP